jgi:threonine dehydratase
MLCEGAAACSLAAAIQLARKGSHKKIACIISGGNVSADVLAAVIQ